MPPYRQLPAALPGAARGIGGDPRRHGRLSGLVAEDGPARCAGIGMVN
jgi:hypothetical protein